MNPVRFWLAIFVLFGFAVVAPGWVYFTTDLASGLPPVVYFLLQLTLPIAVLLTIGSWLEPRGAT